MSTVTPNFNWPVPTSTDLVKDGATAIEALGDSIDASLVDLKGGTTGQVLSKTSNSDMDFTWVAADDTNAIQNTIVDAKGDLIAASAADTPARLAVGNNGETLVADSSTSTGLRWQAPVNVNPVLNSAFQVWQRGTSFSFPASTSYANGFFADRWQTVTSANQACTVSRIATGDTTNLPNIQYATRYQRNSGQTGLGILTIAQNFETINSIPFAGKTVTLSFYARKGANYSNPSSNLNANLIQGTGTDQNAFTGFTGSATVLSQNATLTTSWQRFSFTGTVGATATQLAIYFDFVPAGTAGAADYYDITGVQLEVGSVATPFKTYAGTIQGELAACQRYYYRNAPTSTAGTFATGIGYSTAEAQFHMNLPVTMRTRPTALDTSATNTFAWFNGTLANTPTSIALETGYTTTNIAAFSFVKSGTYAAGTFYLLYANATANAYIGVSAEL